MTVADSHTGPFNDLKKSKMVAARHLQDVLVAAAKKIALVVDLRLVLHFKTFFENYSAVLY